FSYGPGPLASVHYSYRHRHTDSIATAKSLCPSSSSALSTFASAQFWSQQTTHQGQVTNAPLLPSPAGQQVCVNRPDALPPSPSELRGKGRLRKAMFAGFLLRSHSHS